MMTDVAFLVFRAFLITMMTLGMMASLTEFRFGPRKLLYIMVAYSIWVVASSLALLLIGGELMLLRLFFSLFLFRPRFSHTGQPMIPLHKRFLII